MVAAHQLGPGELRGQADPVGLLVGEAPERAAGRLGLGSRERGPAAPEDGTGQDDRCPRFEPAIAARPGDLDQLATHPLGLVRPGPGRERRGPQLEQPGPLGGVVGQGDRIGEIAGCAEVGADRHRAAGGGGQRGTGGGRERRPVGVVGGAAEGVEIVAGDHPGALVAALGLEVAGRGEMAGQPLAPGQPPVGHLAQDALDEAVLAALGRARIVVEEEDLALDQAVEDPDDLVVRPFAERHERPDR